MNRVIRPAARADIIRQFRYYLLDRQAPDAALRFLDSVEKTIGEVVRHPAAGAPRRMPALPGLRSWPVAGFDEIRVFYVATEQSVSIVRVLHGRRDLRHILGRDHPDAD